MSISTFLRLQWGVFPPLDRHFLDLAYFKLILLCNSDSKQAYFPKMLEYFFKKSCNNKMKRIPCSYLLKYERSWQTSGTEDLTSLVEVMQSNVTLSTNAQLTTDLKSTLGRTSTISAHTKRQHRATVLNCSQLYRIILTHSPVRHLHHIFILFLV